MKLLKRLFISVFAFAATLSCSFAQGKSTESVPDVQVQTQTKSVEASDKLNINSASAEDIQKALIGIGAKKAEAIVQYREKYGPFTMAEQLLEVQGIGKATLEKNRDRIIF
ncbi:helix-hairpin-helix domain-containing protein [Rodentibacter caecimuris]|uniref:Competence protein ComE n=1 Tax=Rodentibacter caecimuris TaxID=1796644 RepID=A0ABX3L0G1_9PAST|nr:competence protein ComE [Rodentibacter heylii]